MVLHNTEHRVRLVVGFIIHKPLCKVSGWKPIVDMLYYPTIGGAPIERYPDNEIDQGR